jgi:hypothetical protein
MLKKIFMKKSMRTFKDYNFLDINYLEKNDRIYEAGNVTIPTVNTETSDVPKPITGEPVATQTTETTPDYMNPKNLPWNESPKNNVYGYNEIRKGTETTESMVYRFIPDKQQQQSGYGVLDMQKKLAFVFRHFNYNNVYKKFYIDDPEYRKALTSGIFGGKTMKIVMYFQKIYMKDHFDKYGWNMDAPSNFGMFGGYTKEKLDSLFTKARQEVTARMKQEGLIK